MKMTIQEKQSLRKKKSIFFLVDNGEYSPGYALLLVEQLYDNGKLIETDYEELAKYLEDLLNKPEEPEEEQIQPNEEPTEENNILTEE